MLTLFTDIYNNTCSIVALWRIDVISSDREQQPVDTQVVSTFSKQGEHTDEDIQPKHEEQNDNEVEIEGVNNPQL
jgi:hypothetical protein